MRISKHDDTKISRRRSGIRCDITKKRRDVIVGITMLMLISTNTRKHKMNAEFSHIIGNIICDILMS